MGIAATSFEDNTEFFPKEGSWMKLGTVFTNTFAVYLMWFIPYVIWMLVIGLDLPRTVRRTKQTDGITPRPPIFDTVFHSWMRGGACYGFGSLWGCPVEVSKK